MSTELLYAGAIGIVVLSAAALAALLRPSSWLSKRIDRAVTDTTSVLS